MKVNPEKRFRRTHQIHMINNFHSKYLLVIFVFVFYEFLLTFGCLLVLYFSVGAFMTINNFFYTQAYLI